MSTKKTPPLGTLEEGQKWWELEPPLGKHPPPAILLVTAKKRPVASEVDAFRERGEVALVNTASAFVAMRAANADGDDKFMDQMLTNGTLADRVAAMTLRVQQSPMHELSTIDGLLKYEPRPNPSALLMSC